MLDASHRACDEALMMSGTVVIGTDLSPPASEAVRQGAAWAKARGASLTIVHVAPDDILRALEEPAVTAALSHRVDPIARPLGVPFEVALEAGSAHSGLVRAADRLGAALIVVGASGTDEGALLGGTAERVVRYAHCAVLVARTGGEGGPVLAATDFSPDAEQAVVAAVREARDRGVPLVLSHALHEPTSSLSLLGPLVMSPPEMPESERSELREAARETLRTLMTAARGDGDVAVLLGPPAEAIVDHAKKIGASLVVVATRGRTGLSRIALGSVAEAIAKHAPCSVLAVRRSASE